MKPPLLGISPAIPPVAVGARAITAPPCEMISNLLVDGVVPGLPAAKSGLRAGDIILTADDHFLATESELRVRTDAAKGQALRLGVLRDGRKMAVDIVPELNATHQRYLIGYYPLELVTERSGEHVVRYVQQRKELRGNQGSTICQLVMKMEVESVGANVDGTVHCRRRLLAYLLRKEEGLQPVEVDLLGELNLRGIPVWTETASTTAFYSRGARHICIPSMRENPTPDHVLQFVHELMHEYVDGDGSLADLRRHDGCFPSPNDARRVFDDTLRLAEVLQEEGQNLRAASRIVSFLKWLRDRLELVRRDFADFYSPADKARNARLAEEVEQALRTSELSMHELRPVVYSLRESAVGFLMIPTRVKEKLADLKALRYLQLLRERTGIDLFIPYRLERPSRLATIGAAMVWSKAVPSIDAAMAVVEEQERGRGNTISDSLRVRIRRAIEGSAPGSMLSVESHLIDDCLWHLRELE